MVSSLRSLLNNILNKFLIDLMHATCLAHLILLDFTKLVTIWWTVKVMKLAVTQSAPSCSLASTLSLITLFCHCDRPSSSSVTPSSIRLQCGERHTLSSIPCVHSRTVHRKLSITQHYSLTLWSLKFIWTLYLPTYKTTLHMKWPLSILNFQKYNHTEHV